MQKEIPEQQQQQGQKVQTQNNTEGDLLEKSNDQQSGESMIKLKQQLLEMGFEEYLVEQGIKISKNKDQIIEYVITRLDEADQVHIKDKKQEMQEENDEDFEDITEQYKMIFLVRMDLKMGLGKIAAQVGHATLKAYKQMEHRADMNQLDEVSFFQWLETGQKKIVVKVPDEKQLLTIIDKARDMKMNTCYIRDAGLTQIQAGSLTVGALGPALSSELDSITKHLKLL